MKKLRVILSGLFMLIVFCMFGQTNNDIDIEQFQKKIATENYILVDVRTSEEYVDGHLEGALNINYFSATFSEDIAKLGLEMPVLVYCQSGNRSRKSMKTMYNMGFKEVKNLIGGYKGWVSENNSIIKDTLK